MTNVPGRDRIDLNGTWDLAFDRDEGPTRRDWVAGAWPAGISTEAVVPSVWNARAPDAPAIGYYRRFVDVPAGWSARALRLHVEGACYRLDAWMNGDYAGSHEGAYTGFAFDVTSSIRPGVTNEIVLRVTSLARNRPVEGLVLKEMPVSKQSWYYPESGLWGDVWLEALPHVYASSIAVEPDLRRTNAAFEIALTNTTSDVAQRDLWLSIVDPREETVFEHQERVIVQPGTSRFFVRAPIDRPLAWSYDEPNLYRAEVRLESPESPADHLSATFGMRDFTVRAGQFFLNGEPVYIRGVLMQPSYPAGLLAPLDPAMLETEVRLAKEAGFNMMRVHIRPAVPGFLDLTDRLGMLVYAESSLAWIQETPRLIDHARREVTALIERDRNHPSVVFWGIFNEHRGPSARYSDALIRTARALDPTRVIIDNSGGSLAVDQDFGWIDRAMVVADRSTTREPLQDIHIYAGAPLSKKAFDWFATIGSPLHSTDSAVLGIGSQPIFDEWSREARDDPGQIFVSEIGCGGMGDLESMVAGYEGRSDLIDAREYVAFRDSLNAGFAERRLDCVFGPVAELVRQAQHQQVMGDRRQIEALLINPRVSGYAVTQLADVSCEFHAGILDLWRNPKPVFHEIKRLQQSRAIVMDVAQRAIVAGCKATIAVTLVDQLHAMSEDVLIVTAIDPQGHRAGEWGLSAPIGKGIKPIANIDLPAVSLPGFWRITGRLESDESTACEELVLVLAREVPSGENDDPSSEIVTALQPSMMSSEEWQRFLDAVERGRTGIVGDLRPGDTSAIDALKRAGIDIEPSMGIGSWLGYYHWTLDSPLFDGLPSGGLSGEVYADIMPRYVLRELGGDVLAGSVSNTQTRHHEPMMLWYSDIEVVSLGAGALIFCQYRVFDDALADPVGLRLRQNLLGYANQLGNSV
jgi:hypothetical protein